jgi:hypothetical protein
MKMTKARIVKLEEERWQWDLRRTEITLRGRSVADVDYFCIHGCPPEVPLPGPEYRTSTEPNLTWIEIQRLHKGRTLEERNFFCVHGRFPDEPVQDGHGD